MLGISDIADELGMSRSTTHRYVITLVALGYLEQGAHRKYRLGLGATDIGTAALSGSAIRTAARPYLEELRTQSTHFTSLAVLDGDAVCWLDTLAGTKRWVGPAVALWQPGSRMPAHRTAEGRLLSAFHPGRAGAEWDPTLATADPPANGRTPIPDANSIREHGYVLSEDEPTAGTLTLAAPVRDAAAATVAAISLTAASSKLAPRELLDTALTPLTECAARLTTHISERSGG